MSSRLVALLPALGLLAFPAAANASVGVSISGAISAGVTVGQPVDVVVPRAPVVVRPAPVVIPPGQPAAIVVSPALPPAVVVEAPPTVVVQPVPPSPVVVVELPTAVAVETPPTVAVQPVEPAPVATATPGADVTLQAAPRPEEESEEDDYPVIDLLFFTSYRQVSDLALVGMDLAVRVFLNDELSLESRVGWVPSMTHAAIVKEAPFDVSLLWNPWEPEDSTYLDPIYFGAGLGAVWTDGTYPEGHWLVATRGVVGAELELYDFLLLVAEASLLYRFDPVKLGQSEVGFCLDIGLGFRI